jgi:hypothetical protein
LQDALDRKTMTESPSQSSQSSQESPKARRKPPRVAAALVALFAAIQLVPYGRAHTNPPTRVEPRWSDPEIRALAVRACYDCHSNETRWPWYSHVAPISWLVQHDVDDGRKALNFSEWNRPQKDAHEAEEVVRKGEMPLALYPPLHPKAKLSADERERLAKGLETTVALSTARSEDRR